MGTRGEWLAVVEEVRRDGGPRRSPQVTRLYALARVDGEGALKGFRRISKADRRDYVHDVLATALDDILGADNPRAFFLTCLVNRARSHARRPEVEVFEASRDPDTPAPVATSVQAPGGEAGAMLHDVVRNLSDLVSPRNAQIFIAVRVFGEDREELARVFGTSRVNIDQIVSRVGALLARQT